MILWCRWAFFQVRAQANYWGCLTYVHERPANKGKSSPMAINDSSYRPSAVEPNFLHRESGFMEAQ